MVSLQSESQRERRQGWADYPTLGFNGDWIVVQANVFTVGDFCISRLAHSRLQQDGPVPGLIGRIHLVIMFTGFSGLSGGRSLQHARHTEYLARNWNSRGRDAAHQHDNRSGRIWRSADHPGCVSESIERMSTIVRR